ncbi:WavE lipopolysaccharide synthesis family protein [Vibrio vulnificus]|uniref:WavE lipopolysaccharide synthesis family protein n=1 Tax=Vibrio vulnificus TaxID=672 RepID=UPI001EE9D1B1|nr:WavE lipopolysaccharide synthesis family protein [Vibrio vulnificus]MCG6305577.1 WavE lipopolysaccharide synthesis family protein [Vibrio vulnificus]
MNNINNIVDKDISVVVQGKLYYGKKHTTIDVIKSIRNFFPNSEIILSTWEGDKIPNEVKNIIDNLILSKDPGDNSQGIKPLNINRQIVSSLAGLKSTNRKYVIKTRTDILFTSDNIMSLLSKNLPKNRKNAVSNGIILVSDITTRTHLKPNILQRKFHKSLTYMPFWVCDFLYAGLREDIISIFDIPLYPDSYMIEYKDQKPPGHQHDFKFTPETYLTINFMSKNHHVNFEYSFDNNPSATEFYEKILIDNMLICNIYELGIDSAKYYLPLLPPRQRLLSSKMRIIRHMRNSKSNLFYMVKLYSSYFWEYALEYYRYKKSKKLFLKEK